MRLINPEFKITREHGQFVRRGAFDICAVYHPSALLRDPAKKDEMLADMLKIKKRYDEIK
jgi:DNA polymerase